MTDETREVVEEFKLLNTNLARLTEKVDLAAEVSKKQYRHGWILKIAAIVLAVAIAGTSMGIVWNGNKVQCRALNEANARNADFWRTFLSRVPVGTPGPDATASEIERYEQSRNIMALLSADIDVLGRQRDC